jgi:hypothetical protein
MMSAFGQERTLDETLQQGFLDTSSNLTGAARADDERGIVSFTRPLE